MTDECGRLSFLERPLPPGFERRVVVVAPGRPVRYEEAEWLDAIVLVEHGDIEVEGRSGRRYRFACGAVLWLDGLGVRTVHNAGTDSAVLVAVSRRRPP